MRLLATLVLPLALPALAGAQAFDEEAIAKQIAALDWITDTTTHDIPTLDATYTLDGTEAMVVEADARRLLELTQGHGNWDDVAFVTVRLIGPDAESVTIYSHHDIGYVDDTDWSEVDPKDLLKVMAERTEQSNTERAKRGYPTLRMGGWIETPTYDRSQDTVYWAVQVHDSNGGDAVNAIGLKLSRDGFSRIAWVGTPEQFLGAEDALVAAASAYDFTPGARYSDFTTGDAVAGVSLAALATGVVTGKGWQRTAGAGLVAMLLAFAKKLWFLAFLPFLWVGRLFRKCRPE